MSGIPEDYRLTPEQVDAVDQLVAALERGDITPGQISEGLKAPPPPGKQQGRGEQVIKGLVGTVVTMTLVATMVLGETAHHREGPPEIADIPDEITLEQLLELRRRYSDV
jgi:hypothetical protein